MATDNAIDLNSQGIVYHNGTGTFTGLDGSTLGKVLTSNGTGVAPSFQTAPASSSFSGFVSTGLTASSIADTTTYYLIQSSVLNTSTTSTTASRFYVSSAVTITNCSGILKALTLGSSENATVFIRVNDTTNTNVTTTLQASSTNNTFTNSSLSISLNAGDYFVIGLTTPNYATNPVALLSVGFSS